MKESYSEWSSFGEYFSAIKNAQEGVFDPRLELGEERNFYAYFLRVKRDRQIQAISPPVELTGEKPRVFNQN